MILVLTQASRETSVDRHVYLGEHASADGKAGTVEETREESEEAESGEVVHEAATDGEEAAENRRQVPDGLATGGLGERTAEDGAKAKGQHVEGDRQERHGAGDVELGHQLIVCGTDDGSSYGSGGRTRVSFSKMIKK